MGTSGNVTITNHRLEEGFKNLIEKTTKIPVSQLQQKVNEEPIRICKVTKFYNGIDILEIEIDSKNISKCYANYNIFDTNVNVTYAPKGNEGQDETGHYIQPNKTIYCVAAKLSDNIYVNLGFIDRDNQNINFNHNGELLIQVGNNKISITEDYLNIKTNNFFVNGLPFSEPELSNYPNINEVKSWETSQENNLKLKFNKIVNLVEVSYSCNITNYTSQETIILQDTIPEKYLPSFDIYASCNRGDTTIIFYHDGRIGFRCEENISNETIYTSSLWSCM